MSDVLERFQARLDVELSDLEISDIEAAGAVLEAIDGKELDRAPVADALGGGAESWLRVFSRGLLAGDAGTRMVSVALDSLASAGSWPLLEAAARVAGADSVESPHAGDLLRAWGHLGQDDELARLGGEILALDPGRIPPRFRLPLAQAIKRNRPAARLARRSAVEHLGHRGTEDEVEVFFDLVGEDATIEDVESVTHLLDLLHRREATALAEPLLEILALALLEQKEAGAVWSLALGTAQATGSLPGGLAEQAAEALQQLHSEFEQVEDWARQTRSAGGGSDPLAELQRIERAIEWHSGAFVKIGAREYRRIESCDGREITLVNRLGERQTEALAPSRHRRVDADIWAIRAAFFTDELKAELRREPLIALERLVRQHPGKLTDVGLRSELTAGSLIHFTDWERWFGLVKDRIRNGEGGVCFDARRRSFSLGKPKKVASARKPVAKRAPTAAPVAERTPAKSAAGKTNSAADGDDYLVFKVLEIPAVKDLLLRLKEQLGSLDRELRIDIPEKLRSAAAHGDLRENAEYDAAKERKSYVEILLKQLMERTQSVQHVEQIRCRRDHAALFRSVKIANQPEGEIQTIHLVPNQLADPDRSFVSVGSPLGKALNRQPVGSQVVLTLPRGTRTVKIVGVGVFGQEPE